MWEETEQQPVVAGGVDDNTWLPARVVGKAPDSQYDILIQLTPHTSRPHKHLQARQEPGYQKEIQQMTESEKW